VAHLNSRSNLQDAEVDEAHRSKRNIRGHNVDV
jgi:hypothetical protein